MKFSIITPNYNGSTYLEKCIESVLSQNVNFEHIVVDGKSTDSSQEILGKYPHLKVICEEDKGMYDAINKGIKLSTGEIIAYLNCDDRYPKGSLQSVLEAFERKANIDYVVGNCRFINQQEDEVYVYKIPLVFESLLKKITVIPWAQPSVFYKKNVFDSVGLYKIEYTLAADYHFMKKVILSNFKRYKLNTTLSCFMKRKDALSSQNSKDVLDQVNLIKKELEHIDNPFLDLCFNSYRKVYNLKSYFKKNK